MSATKAQGAGRTVCKRLDVFRRGVAVPNNCIKGLILRFAPAQGRGRICYETRVRFGGQLPQGQLHTLRYGRLCAKRTDDGGQNRTVLRPFRAVTIEWVQWMHRIPIMS